jgi:hexosaminidase
MPGHAASWCKGYPSVCPSPTCAQPLNPASPDTFELITALLGECTGKAPLGGLFPESMIHLGGDEVNTGCWTKSPAVAAWLTARNMTADQGYGFFVNRTAHIAAAQGRRPVQWNEVRRSSLLNSERMRERVWLSRAEN